MKHDDTAGATAPESARIDALRRTGLLGSPADASFDRLARLACRLLNAPVALVSLIDADRQFFVSCAGLPEPWASRRETPLSHSFCRHVVESGAALVVDDAREHERLRDNPAIAELGAIAYAGVPLVGLDGHVLGSFCVIDQQPRHWTEAQVEVLADLAASVQTEIHLRESVHESQRRGEQNAESRRQFEDIVQGLDAIVWEADLESGFTFVSQHAEALLGHPARRWIEEPTFWSDGLVHPDDRGFVVDLCRTEALAGRNHEFEYRAIHANGGVVWLRELVRVEQGADGNPRHLRGLMIDITAEKTAAVELRKRESQLAQAQAVARMGGWEHDLLADRVTWSDETYRICGLEPQSVEASLEMLTAMVHPDDRERVTNAVEHTVRTGEPYCEDIRLVLADGTVRHVQSRGEAVMDADGRVVRLHGVGQDITERRVAEEARRQAEEDAQTMARRMHAVASAASAVIGAASVDALLPILRDACQQVISLDAFWLSLYDEPAHTFAYAGYDRGESISTQVVAAAGTPSERVLRARRSIVTHRSTDPDAAGGIVLGTQRRSESIIRTPILSGSRVLGVLSVQSYTPELYSERDVEVLEAIASLAATALLNLELLAERESAAEALARSESRFKELFDKSPDPIFLLDGRVFTDCNQAAVELMRFEDKDGILGRHPAELSAAFQAGGSDSFASADALMDLARAEGHVVFEWLIRRADGEVFPAEVAMTAFPLEERRVLHVVARDITARKQAEEALLRANEELEARVAERTAELQQRGEEMEAVFRALPDLFFRLSGGGEILDHRSELDTRLFLAPAPFVGRSLDDLLTAHQPDPDDRARIREAILHASRTGELTTMEYLLPEDGGDRHYEARLIRLDDGSLIAIARDITDRKEAEHELTRREEHFRRLIENAHDMVHVIDGSGDTLYVSPSVERILGYTPAELVGGSALMLVHPDDIARGEATLAQVYTQPGVTAIGEFRLRHKDGSYRTVESFGRLVSADEPGNGVVINTRDITDRVAAEQELQERETRFRRLTENSSDLVQIIYPDSRMGYTGPSVVHLLGYTPEEVDGLSNMEFIHPDDRDTVAETIHAIFATPGASRSVRYRVRHRDGRWRVFEAFGRTLLPDSAEEGLVCNARDITERHEAEEALRRSEEHFRRLTENAYDMVLVMDAAGTITYASPSAQRVLGCAPEELVGRSGFSLVHPDDLEYATEHLREVFAAPGEARVAEVRIRHRGGGWRVIESYSRTLLPDSAAGGLVVNARDITERKHFEEALRDSEEHFRRLIENSSDVISIVDADGTVRFQSDAVRRLYGWDPADGVGTSWERVHPDDLPALRQSFAHLLERPAETQTARFRFLDAAGAFHPVEAVAKAIGDPPQGAVISMRDIRERLEAEEALRDSEARYRSLIENAHDIVTILDLEGRIMYQSPQVERVLGYDPLELLGQNALDLVHPDDVATPAGALEQILSTPGSTFTSEYRFRHKDGSWRYLETFGRTLVPDSPEQGLVFNSRDVTERREAQRLLEEREEHFRKLIETSHDLIQTLDPQGNIVYTGPSVERLLGYRPEEITGSGANDFIHPDDRPAVAAKIVDALTNPGKIIHLEYRVLHKDGRWRWFEALGRTLSADTAEFGMVANARDVTERREAEQEIERQRAYFEQLLASVEAGISAWDPRCRFEYVSNNAVLEPEAREFIIGKTHAEYYAWCGKPQEVAAQRHHFVEEAIRTRRPTEFEDPLALPDGTTQHMLRRYWPVWDEADEVVRVIGYSVDITHRKRAEEEAERAREAAERANRAKSEFLSRMSHELRTPMNSILGFAQLLDRSAIGPEHRKGVGHILKAGRHLLQLINEVLEIARIEAGRHSLSLEPVRAGTVIQEAVGLVRPLAAQWRVELDEGPWPCCSAYVRADRQRLTQVLLNLLANAIKYNRPGGRVWVSCEARGEGERQRLVLRVHDTGRGIDPERADQLFTPFARLGAEQTEVEGTGLGLALSQRLTEAMGGALILESTGVEGSVFQVELQVTADPLERLEDQAAAPPLNGAEHAPATLLYIEDNLANLSLVETILLSRPQWRTMPALQGQIGVELAREHTPDLVLLDLHLPDISGEEVLRRLRADPRTASIPVVMITADATRTAVDRLRAAGADAYLTKPLDIDEFLETLERFLPSPE